jgi:hypothetical protein
VRRTTAFIVSALAVAALAGCGDGDDEATTTTIARGTTSPTAATTTTTGADGANGGNGAGESVPPTSPEIVFDPDVEPVGVQYIARLDLAERGQPSTTVPGRSSARGWAVFAQADATGTTFSVNAAVRVAGPVLAELDGRELVIAVGYPYPDVDAGAFLPGAACVLDVDESGVATCRRQFFTPMEGAGDLPVAPFPNGWEASVATQVDSSLSYLGWAPVVAAGE